MGVRAVGSGRMPLHGRGSSMASWGVGEGTV